MSARTRAQHGSIGQQQPLPPVQKTESNSLLPRIGQLQRANTANGQKQRYGAQHEKQYGPAPVWRKTHKQAVDEKIGKLFESYRKIDMAAHSQRAQSGYEGPMRAHTNEEIAAQLAQQRRHHYF